MLDQADLEGSAESLYRLAGMDPQEPASPARIARAILGPRAIEVAPMRITTGAVVRVHGETRIALKRGLDTRTARFVVAHELGHVILEREGYFGEDIETACDYIAGALLMPRRHFFGAFRWAGGDASVLAEDYGVTESAAWLRRGETIGDPLALVRPGLVRTRGVGVQWPDEQTIVGWARSRPPRGLAKAKVRDDPRRVVLFADGRDLADCA